jgi:hypothetical protein
MRFDPVLELKPTVDIDVSPLSPDTLEDVDDKPLDFVVLNRGTYVVERTGVNP